MNRSEKKAVSALAGLFALRMFGLFMLLPVLAIYATQLPGSTPLLIGLALGIYGLTQGLLQIVFGMASDRFGRKRVISIGLIIFALGSVVAALADSISGLLIGRAIQGAGAISAAVLALTADLTRESQRTKAMAVLGVSIGFVFVLSLMFAPLLQGAIGVPGIFWLSAGLAVLAILVLYWVVPHGTALPDRSMVALSGQRLRSIVADSQLLRLDFGGFCLHLSLTATFVVLPALLQTKSGLPLAAHWQLYAPLLGLSVLGMLVLLRIGARNRGVAPAFNTAIGLLMLASIALAWTSGHGHGLAGLMVALWLFFVAFNALEAMLPSLISRLAPATDKGAAIGVYNTFQFLGMFVGGLVGGWLGGYFGVASVYWFCAVTASLWLVIALTATKFRLGNA